eukprot:scaffold1513_cov100-Amphora_coffeaeformis.AAC.25
MLGVSPLLETDLKNARIKDSDDDWQQRAAQRERMAPPEDALNKPSVAIFFFVLGLVPVVTLWASVQWGGIKPMGL